MNNKKKQQMPKVPFFCVFAVTDTQVSQGFVHHEVH